MMATIVGGDGPISTTPLLWTAVGCAAVATLYVVRRRTAARSKLPLPPGPRKLPFIGNLLDMPASFQWERCMEWSAEYDSDIIHLNIAGTSMVVLSSIEATEALLDKRSAIYSDRADFPMVKDLMGWGFNIGLMKYGDVWRAHRRLFSQELNQIASQRFLPRERAATHKCLRRLLKSPNDWVDHLRQMLGEQILAMAYGIEVEPENDPFVALAEQAIQTVATAGIPGKYLVDSIPLLRYIPAWMPGAGFQKAAKEGRRLGQAVLNVPFAETKRQIAAGSAPSSFAGDTLRALSSDSTAQSDLFFTESTVKSTAASMYLAGADTTVSSLHTFVLAMLVNPEAQRKAQEEIDAVVGKGGLPDFVHRESLPYVEALVKEVLRWRNVTPFGVPHYITEEDEYRGYRIPANSMIMGNVWAILHDEAMYPDADTFKPERFLNADGTPNPDVKSPQAAFGFGRRICPGRHLAASSMWIGIASILASFNITKAVDAGGNVIEPTYEYVTGLLVSPAPFKCSIKPRSRDAVELVQSTANEI